MALFLWSFFPLVFPLGGPVAESGAEVVFTTPKMYQMYLKDPAFEAAVKRVMGRPVRITIKLGEVKPGESGGLAEPLQTPAGGAPAGNQDPAAAERGKRNSH